MILELMRSRRSVRKFKPEIPERAAIEGLIEAAVSAPSASNKQPWRFLIITNKATISNLAAAVRRSVEKIAKHIEPSFETAFLSYGDYFTRFEGAPVVIVPLYRSLTVLSNMLDRQVSQAERANIELMENNSGLIGTALAIQTRLLMAHASGLGASGMTGPLVALDLIREILEVPPSWQVAALIPVGFPAEEPTPTARKPIAAVTRWL